MDMFRHIVGPDDHMVRSCRCDWTACLSSTGSCGSASTTACEETVQELGVLQMGRVSQVCFGFVVFKIDKYILEDIFS